MREDRSIVSAEFDQRVIGYFWVQALLVQLISLVGIPLIPIWLIAGRAFHKKQYENLSCQLTDRSLNIRKGVLIKVQKNIPLDKITDLAVNEGPLLRHFGLCSLNMETAGSAQGSTGHLFGVVDPLEFRDKVLAQRDLVTSNSGALAAAPAAAFSADGSVLVEIRDTLQRIEKSLSDRS